MSRSKLAALAFVAAAVTASGEDDCCSGYPDCVSPSMSDPLEVGKCVCKISTCNEVKLELPSNLFEYFSIHLIYYKSFSAVDLEI